MRVVFRADASLEIGTGHVMRCLTLADALRGRGMQCRFVCRDHPGELLQMIRRRGHEADALLMPSGSVTPGPATLPRHAAWLGVDWRIDASHTQRVLASRPPDWLVVDHYGLDWRWETEIRSYCGRLMVIDDLADRSHRCDLLLDQTYGRKAVDYARLTPATCKLLCGSQFALLRPEFAEWRGPSLRRREQRPRLNRLLVSMGGIDKGDATSLVLDALERLALPSHYRVTVVMGAGAPWLDNVRRRAERSRQSVEVRVDVRDMARLMAESDLAIGAAGTTSWERCCLGLPAVLVALAANQEALAVALERAGVAWALHDMSQVPCGLPILLEELSAAPSRVAEASRAASMITDGRGTMLVAETIMGCSK